MRRKEFREITGYTFANQASNEESWYNSAISFHEGASILAQHKDSIPGGIRVFLLNVALSMELLLKAIIVAQGESPEPDHKLRIHADKAGVGFTKSQKTTLELLEQILKWSGRYPVPNKPQDWDTYHDQILERHVIREREGNTYRTRANPSSFPSVENCDGLWMTAKQRWDEIHPH